MSRDSGTVGNWMNCFCLEENILARWFIALQAAACEMLIPLCDPTAR